MSILVVNPTLARLSTLGACEQDRLANVRDLVADSHELRVLSRASPYASEVNSVRYYANIGVEATILPPRIQRWRSSRFRDLAFLDGAVWDYGSPNFLRTLGTLLATWRPTLVWCHASYVWPSSLFAKRLGVPVILRSVSNEAHHLTGWGWTLGNRVRYLSKRLGEYCVTHASVRAAITPVKQAEYAHATPRATVHLLPLRTLPGLLNRTPRAPSDGPLRSSSPDTCPILMFTLRKWILPSRRACRVKDCNKSASRRCAAVSRRLRIQRCWAGILRGAYVPVAG